MTTNEGVQKREFEEMPSIVLLVLCLLLVPFLALWRLVQIGQFGAYLMREADIRGGISSEK